MSLAKNEFVNLDNTRLTGNNKFVNSLKKDHSNVKDVEAKKRNFLKTMAGNGADAAKAKMQYKNALVQNTNYLVESQLIFTDFLNRGSMTADNRTWFYTLDEPITDNEARVYQITQHGNAPVQGIVMSGDVVYVVPYMITTEEVSMSKYNMRMGDITNEQKMRARASRKLTKMTETDALSLLENGLITDISNIAGIEIDADVKDYPQATDINLTGTGNKITMDVMKAIVKHFMLLGKPVRNIYVPATRMTDLWDWMSMPAGYADDSGITADKVVPTSVQEQIVRTGTVNSLFGYPVNLIPVNTLNGNAANGDVNLWVNTNEGAGEYRIFDGMVNDVYQHEDAQRIYYSISRATAMFQTPRQRLNYARFTLGD